jgi:hypothetical protein
MPKGPKSLKTARVLFLGAVCAIGWFGSISHGTAKSEKMTPEEVIAKHLDSIGSEQDRSSVRNMIVKGSVSMALHAGGKGRTDGQALLASQTILNLIYMDFGAGEYPFEKMGYDGKSLTVRHQRPGYRSPLGQFFLAHQDFFSEGLIGGALSTSWPFHNLTQRKPKLSYAGTKKVSDRQMHQLRYVPSKGSDLKISVFFDAETFQHVRTEYERSVAAVMGPNPRESASQRETRYKVVEKFSDFKKEGALTLPHKYELELSIQGQRGNMKVSWEMILTEFSFNQSMKTEDFIVDK